MNTREVLEVVVPGKVGKRKCALISRQFTVNLLETADDVEILAFDILLDAFNYRCILCYRPPEYDGHAWLYLSSLLSCIDKLTSTCDSNILIVGDFNLPYLSWDTLLVSGLYAKFHQSFIDCTCQLGLCQCVDEPTRGENILDLVLVNDPLLISKCVVTVPFSNSDHETVEFDLVLPCIALDNQNYCCKYYFNFKEADYDGLNAYFSDVDWKTELSVNLNEDINSCMSSFIAILNEGINLFVPVNRVVDEPSSSNSRAHVHKYPVYIRQLFRKKIVAWRLYKRCRNKQLLDKYKSAEDKFSLAVNCFNAAKENEIIDSNNIGAFYKYINNKLVTIKLE